MPFQEGLDDSTEMVFLHGNVVVETELEVYLHAMSEHAPNTERKSYIDANAVPIRAYPLMDEKIKDPSFVTYIK